MLAGALAALKIGHEHRPRPSSTAIRHDQDMNLHRRPPTMRIRRRPPPSSDHDQTLHGEVSSECFQALHGSLNDDHATEGPKATKNTPPTDEPRMKAPKITTPTEEPNMTTKTTTPTEEPRKTTNITTLSEWAMGMW